MKRRSAAFFLILDSCWIFYFIDKFSHTMHHPNNRPVQPVNARVILK